MYYALGMGADWSQRGEYIAKHGVTPAQADEALADDDAVVFNPDYAAITGAGVRTIGRSVSFGDILTVITVEHEGVVYGASAWKSNKRDRGYYEQGGA